ncbi:sensor histidine kinase [Alkalicoccobacillus murimartini]|uniref:histidine kinase n=1 Tax=Alkalicoccobacillus murimartini TaxID=171685 RepID=A0ABT9YLY0_9BACI|nr:sensor histidine kinase [Alkalicoccobacillus murimartini]MDQ0208197.1 two-component system sensor histidine kinase YesM [Alkalicoccobacillus murimartini]
MIKWGRRKGKGIKNKIITIAILQLVFFCLMGTISFHFITAVYEKQVYDESANTLSLTSTVLDEELRKIEQISFQINTDSVIQNYMEGINYEYFGYDVYRTKRLLIDRLNAYYSQEKYISSIHVVDTFGEIYVVGDNRIGQEIDREWTEDMKEAGGANTWQSITDEGVLVSTREMRKMSDLSLVYLGAVIITIDMGDFISGSLNFSPDKSFVIMKDEEIMYTNNMEEGSESQLEPTESSGYQVMDLSGSEYFITSQRSRHSELFYYNILPFDQVTGQTKWLNGLMIFSFILFLAIILLISRSLARAISKPLEELTSKMKHVQEGKFESLGTTDKHSPYDEIGQLHTNFDLMIEKINTLIRENYTKQLIIKETEYRALQAQINPHFLYNTLDSINWLAKMNKQSDISQIAEALGNMMRNIISKKEPLITIDEELDIVRAYMVIQKYRYKERLQFTLEHPENMSAYRIPKLTIQPIIENAIQHSLEEVISVCTIDVNIRCTESKVTISIRDNGVGMDEATIQSIYAGNVKPKRSGIGLYNIIERIHLMFGEAYGLSIESELDKGTTVFITLPNVEE